MNAAWNVSEVFSESIAKFERSDETVSALQSLVCQRDCNKHQHKRKMDVAVLQEADLL